MNSKAIKKQLLAAVAMVLVAAVALGSSTYAWFVASNDVKAEGMMLQVQGDTGIVIKSVENTQSKFAATASAGMTESTKLKPTSTIDLATWYHAESDQKDNAKAAQDKTAYTDVTENVNEYVLQRNFIIRSATNVPLTNVKLAVKSLTVTPKTQSSENLDRAVRVGVKINNNFWIFAPLADTKSPIADNAFTLQAKYVDDSSTLKEPTTVDSNTHTFALAGTQIPATDEGVPVAIYMWFEGEDGNCMSDNIKATLDDLAVTVEFSAAAA